MEILPVFRFIKWSYCREEVKRKLPGLCSEEYKVIGFRIIEFKKNDKTFLYLVILSVIRPKKQSFLIR